MRAGRLVSILLLLQTRGRMTARQLADEMEVSLRTIYRDLDELAVAGVPVYAERGATGGYRLVDGYRTRLTGLSAEEAEALFLSGLEGPAAELGLETVLAAAQLKVLAALPPELRGRTARIRERFHLVGPGWFSSPEEVPLLTVVAEALWESRRLSMRYRRGETEHDRLVEPLGLVLQAGTWYLVARREGAVRTYRVSRIVAARVQAEPFERPPDFELAAYWERSVAEFERSLAQVPVTLRVRGDRVDELAYALGGRGRLRGAGGPLPAPDANGWVTLDLRLESIEGAHDDLLRLGASVEVLAPDELRHRLRETAAEIATLYRLDVEAPRPGDARGTGPRGDRDGGDAAGRQ